MSIHTSLPRFRTCVFGLTATLLALNAMSSASAALLYWDPNGSTAGTGGDGTWQTGVGLYWSPNAGGGGTMQAWSNSPVNTAYFGGTAGTVTVSGSVVTNTLTFTAGGYALSGNTVSLQAPVSTYGGTVLDVGNVSGNTTISNNLDILVPDDTGGARYMFKNAGSGTLTINGNVTLNMNEPATAKSYTYDIDQTNASGRIVLNGTFGNAAGTSTATLRFAENSGVSGAIYEVNGDNTGLLDGGSRIVRGTVLLGNANALGSQLIKLGSGGTQSGQVAALLTNGAMTIANGVQIGDNGSQTAEYVIGGNTAHASTFSGNFVSYNDMPMTLRAAAGGTVTFSGQINHQTSKLIKDGAGTVYLTRAAGNAGAGDTEVRQGTLIVTNTSGSAYGSGNLTLKSGATIGGSGILNASTVSTKISIESGGILMGGEGLAATGTLTLAGTTEFLSGSIIKLVLGPSLAHSTINRSSGAWTFDTAQTFTFNLLDGALAGTYQNIITNVGSNTNISGLTPGSTIAGWQIDPSTGASGYFTFDGTNVDLVITTIPEPSAFLLLGLGLMTVFFVRRKSVRA